MAEPKPVSEVTQIDSLKGWDKNPRTVTIDDMQRLTNQIKRLGVYKPILVTSDNVVIGGNMRLEALKKLGEKEVWISRLPFDSKNSDKVLEYALSDNDRIGTYNDTQLAELVSKSKINVADFKVDLGSPISLDNLLGQFGITDREVDESQLEKDMDSFMNGSVKQIVVYFTNDQYMDVMQRLEVVKQETGLETNTDLFMALLSFWEQKNIRLKDAK